MSDDMHICQPYDTTLTLCDLPAGALAAVNYEEYFRARGPFCPTCEAAALRHKSNDDEDPPP